MAHDRPAVDSTDEVAVRLHMLGEAESLAGLGSWAWLRSSGTAQWSPNMFRLLGYSPGQVIPSSEAFLARVHPDDRARVREQSAAAAATGTVDNIEYRLLLPDGVERTIVGRMSAVGGGGDLYGIISDVTDSRNAARESRRVAAELAEAQQIAKVGSWSFDIETGELTWSDGLRELFGVGPDVVPTRQFFYDMIHPDDRAKVREGERLAIEEGKLQRQEFRLIRPDGELRWFYSATKPVWGDGPGVRLFVGTNSDVTELKQLQEKLARAQVLEALGRLAVGVAHDFNNLLTVIMAHADEVGATSPAAASGSRVILDAASKAADLTRQLLSFGRASPGESRLCDLDASVRDAGLLVERLIGEDIRVELDLGSGGWLVRADPSQLSQMVVNLAINARDAMPDGGQLTLRTRQMHLERPPEGTTGQARAGDFVSIEVEDTGTGMEPDIAARIFEPFFTTKDPGRGTGLGLALVYGLVTQSDGFLAVRTAPGAGTRISCYLPRVAAVRPEEAASVSDRRRSAVAPASILVVEDDATVRGVIDTILSRVGHKIARSPNANAAAELWAQGGHYDLVITDMVLTAGTGRNVFAMVRETHPNMPVLFISGYSPERLSDLLDARSDFLQKPFRPTLLVEKVSNLLARSRPAQEAASRV